MNARQNHSQAKALIDAWEVVMRYRWQFILPAFLVCAAILTASLLLPRKYRAVAIFERRTDMVMEEIMNRGASDTYEGPRATLVSEITGETAIDDVMEQHRDELMAIARRGGYELDLTELRRDLLRSVLVQRDIHTKQLDRVRVSYVGTQPHVARFAVNALVTTYIDRTRRELDRRLTESEQFFETEVARARETIEKLENGKLTFEIEHAELMPDSPNSLQTAMIDAKMHLAQTRERRDTAVAQVAALEQRLANTNRTIPEVVTTRNPEIDRLETQLGTLNAKHNEYVRVFKMTDKHPDLIDLRDQIAAMKEKIAALPREVVSETRVKNNPKYEEVELLLAQARATAESLDRQTEIAQTHIKQNNAASVELYPVRAKYSKIEREIDQAMRQLSFWENNLNRVRMSSTAENGNRGIKLNFIKPCGELSRPVSPDLKQVLLAAVGLSLFAGALSVVLAHRTNETFNTGEDLANTLDVPLAGAVSQIISRRQRRAKRVRHMIIYPLNLALMAGLLITMAGLLYLNLERPEQFQKLMNNPTRWLSEEPSDAPAPQSPKRPALALMQEDR